MSLGQLTSSEFYSCEPFSTTVIATQNPTGGSNPPGGTVTTTWTTTYTTTLPAACSTSQWTATYTVTEVCTGDPDDFTTPAIPPNFVTTTIVCNVCNPNTMVITCPGPTSTGEVTINGNGITAASMPHAGPNPSGAPSGPDNTAAPDHDASNMASHSVIPQGSNMPQGSMPPSMSMSMAGNTGTTSSMTPHATAKAPKSLKSNMIFVSGVAALILPFIL